MAIRIGIITVRPRDYHPNRRLLEAAAAPQAQAVNRGCPGRAGRQPPATGGKKQGSSLRELPA